MNLLYDIGIRAYSLLVWTASPFNSKAKKFHTGRKHLLAKVKANVKADSPIIWFHCSSVGEFEQARPIIEWYKANSPEYKILLTFFSPSGYELRKNYNLADWVYYMPVDTAKNAKRFVEIVKPKKAIFIKYEFWYNFLTELKKSNTDVYIISAIFRESQPFFKWYGCLFRKMLASYKHIFVQDEHSAKLLQSVGIHSNITISGDTRFDRVYAITQSANEFPLINGFTNSGINESDNFFTIVAGSTWPPDENLISDVLNNFSRIKLVIAPHEIGKDHIASIEKLFSKFNPVKFSALNEKYMNAPEGSKEREDLKKQLAQSRVLIIDCIGILSSIYRYGHLAYIGGGFGVGIHNILEAATYGIPILFGPNYRKFKEAKDLINLKGAYSINNASSLYDSINKYINHKTLVKEHGDICKSYVINNLGATKTVVRTIEGRE